MSEKCPRCESLTGRWPRETAAKGAFGALLDGAEAVSPLGVIAIGETTGPRPFDPTEAAGEVNPE